MDAQAVAVALITSAKDGADECAQLATEVGLDSDVNERVLVAFCLLEAAWSWSSPAAGSEHPVHGPALDALRCGDRERVRALLVGAMSGKGPGSYAALLVQFAYLVVRMADDLDVRLARHGLRVAADPGEAWQRPAGPVPSSGGSSAPWV